MKVALKLALFLILSSQFLILRAQSLDADSVHAVLQGEWRMNEDTNVVLVFSGDSMTHRMMHSWGHGRSHFLVTDHNCDTTRFIRKDALYIVETYQYFHGTQPMIGEICNKIIHLKDNVLILKRDGVFESYTKIQSVVDSH